MSPPPKSCSDFRFDIKSEENNWQKWNPFLFFFFWFCLFSPPSSAHCSGYIINIRISTSTGSLFLSLLFAAGCWYTLCNWIMCHLLLPVAGSWIMFFLFVWEWDTANEAWISKKNIFENGIWTTTELRKWGKEIYEFWPRIVSWPPADCEKKIWFNKNWPADVYEKMECRHLTNVNPMDGCI